MQYALYYQLAVEKVVVEKNGGPGEVFYQNKEMKEFYNPFRIVYTGDVITSISFNANDSIWSKNFKRAIASALQIQGDRIGAFVEKEVSSHLPKSSIGIIIFAIFAFPPPAWHPWQLLQRILRV